MKSLPEGYVKRSFAGKSTRFSLTFSGSKALDEALKQVEAEISLMEPVGCKNEN